MHWQVLNYVALILAVIGLTSSGYLYLGAFKRKVIAEHEATDEIAILANKRAVRNEFCIFCVQLLLFLFALNRFKVTVIAESEFQLFSGYAIRILTSMILIYSSTKDAKDRCKMRDALEKLYNDLHQ